MNKFSFAHATFSLLVVLAHSNLATASSAPFTPKTNAQLKNIIATTFKPNTDAAKELRKIQGFASNNELITFFCEFSINDAYEALNKSDTTFATLPREDKQRKIWAKIEGDMVVKATIAFTDAKHITELQINRLVGNITDNKFMEDWEAGDWANIVATPKSTPNTKDDDVDDKTKPDAAATNQSPADTTSGTSTPPPFSPTGGAKTPKAGAAIGDNKTPNPDSGKSPKQDTPKKASPDDDTKKSFKLSEYRKTIIAGIAFVGISAWLYSKYNHIETQNSMNAGTAA